MMVERTSVFSFSKKDVIIELSVFCALVVGYSVIEIRHVLSKSKAFSVDVANEIIGNISNFIPVAFVFVLTLEIGWYFIMILWNWHKREIEAKARAEGRVEGRAEGKVEGHAEGKVEGRAEINKSWVEWNARRLEAQKNNGKFDEPPPSES